MTTNWNNTKNKLEHKKYINNKYYKKQTRKEVDIVLTDANKKLRYYTNDIDPSPAEALIMMSLEKLKIRYLREVSFNSFITPNGGYYRFDFYIPSKNILIEYDGKEWHKDNPSDKAKDDFCKKYKIKLIRLDYKDYYKFTKVLKKKLKYEYK